MFNKYAGPFTILYNFFLADSTLVNMSPFWSLSLKDKNHKCFEDLAQRVLVEIYLI